MRLSAIKLAGFKSFTDPTTLPLPSNLTSVVGPNGCGKSNIIDAIRWLLGENSMRQLRSETMDDVIFNGSKTRKPAGRASVELLFDNSDGAIAGPYAAYSEIAVRRELTRDGNSQYFLNGAKCLKRDVTDLFLGTGLGGRSQYAIIEQGMVSRMIEAKPEELRQWLEEAAGISKYRERRRETESRIKQTRENLARLTDLRMELQARLEALRKQASNAEKYKEYKEQERKLKAELLALRWRSLEVQCLAQESAIGELGQALDEAKAKFAEAQDERAAAETAHQAENQNFNDFQGKLYEAEATQSRHEQSLQHTREMSALRSRELGDTQRQIDELTQRDTREQARSAELAAALEQQEAQLKLTEQHEAEAQDQLILAEEQGQAGQLRWDEFIQRAEGPLSQLEAERVRVQQLERQVRAGEERLTRLRAEQAGLDASPIQATLQDADAELQVLQRDLADVRAQLQNLDREVQELRDARAAAEGALHEARQALQGARGRLSSLETLQAAALRQDDAELNVWLRERGLDGSRRFASALQVESGWEAAVEHVLDHLLQAPLVADLQGKIAGLGGAPKSGVALIQDAGNASDGVTGQLSAKASGPAALIGFLHGIFVVETLDEARQRAASLRAGESVITRDGVWFGRDWVRYPRTDKDRSGVIARGALLKQLRVEVEAQAETVRTREQSLDELRNRTQTQEGQRRELSNRLDQIRGREAQRNAFRQAQAVRLEQTESRARQLGQELTNLSSGHALQSDELMASRESLVQLEETARQLREERGSLQQDLARLREAVQRARQVALQSAVARGQAQMQLASRRSALDALRQGLQDLLARRESLQQNKARQEAELAALNEPLQQRAQEAGAAAAVVREAREALRLARERLTAAEVRHSESAHRVQDAQFEQDAARERLQQAQIDSQGMMVRRQTLAEQIVETGYDRAVLLEALKEEITPEAWDEKLASMARRIERLGPINLAAIQELEEAQARETELGRQHEDISSALTVLEEAIAKIDHETQERFKQTFDRVNEIFQDRFPKLFGGGEAYLELTDANLLETGVRVMARPPGKRNSTIHLLSGGEKAMTAVALLLALFQLNPAPFCLMDEVDAPLDDANVSRFCEVVQEMALTVQFIIITHNKITMELANQLHGVTMQEPGVSRLVSVSVQEAVKLTETGEVKELA